MSEATGQPSRGFSLPLFLLGASFLVFGAVSVWDSLRIERTFRLPGAFDPLGPDRYLMLLAVLLLVLGGTLIIACRNAPLAVKAPAEADESETASAPWHVVVIVALLAGYVAAALALGYPIATLLFFIAAFWFMEAGSWLATLIGAIVLAAAFYVIFVIGADMPLPKGWFF